LRNLYGLRSRIGDVACVDGNTVQIGRPTTEVFISPDNLPFRCHLKESSEEAFVD